MHIDRRSIWNAAERGITRSWTCAYIKIGCYNRVSGLRSTRRKNTQRNHGGFKSEFHGSSPWIYMHGKRIYRARSSQWFCLCVYFSDGDAE